jgi:hypothetical protein
MASDHRYYGAVTLYFYLVCHFGQTAPKAPGLPGNKEQYLQNVDNLYITDAYHLLSIERYRVTPELIERVRLGLWNSKEPLGRITIPIIITRRSTR